MFLRMGQCKQVRRSPHGERGLKSNGSSNCLPATSRSPHGERGLKFTQRIFDDNIKLRRSPHGERGLKCCIQIICNNTWESLPARGAWIEIQMTFRHYLTNQSLPARGAWIEIYTPQKHQNHVCGRPPHGGRGLKCLPSMRHLLEFYCRSPHGGRGLKS